MDPLILLTFSSPLQDWCFENVLSGQVTLLERECFWNEQPGLLSSKRHS